MSIDNLSLKYQRCTLSDYKDIAIRIFKFVAKTQFLYATLLVPFCDLIAPLVLILCTQE